MKRIILLLVLGITGVCHMELYAQRKINSVDQLSDQQITQLWQQTQKAGMTENDAIKELVRRGLDPTQVDALKKRLVKMQGSGKNSSNKNNLIADTARFVRDSTWKFEIPDIRIPSPYYGFDFFNNPLSSFTPNINMATPANYILGPGDELILTISGLNELTHTQKINREGNFELPHAGLIQLNGLSIEQATTRIRNKLRLPYPALSSGQSQLLLTLGNVRSVRVTVIGETERPGDYTVSSLAGFFNVLYLSGGPAKNGSLRAIELIRNNKLLTVIDFYKFLQQGILDQDIRLQDRDVIRFPLYGKRVTISGAVKRPFVYELLDKETMTDLLKYAGGWSDKAVKEVVKVSQTDPQGILFRDVAERDFSYFIPRNGDSVFVEQVSNRFVNRVMISNGVQKPGNYELTSGLSLLQLIQKANGLREDAFLNRGYIRRQAPGTTEPLLVSFSVKDVLAGTEKDIPLFREDSVVIHTRGDLESVVYITVNGNVQKPGTIAFRKGMTLEDAILMSGGFTSDAATHKVEISRLSKNRADTLANRLLNMITVSVDSALSKNAPSYLLEPLDYIFVPKLLNYQSLGSIKMRGEVLYEGDYVLERRDETIQDVLRRAGGISPFAALGDVQVYRNQLRVATTNLLEGKESQFDKFILLPNDSIFIPRSVPFVEIKGAVFNPQIVNHTDANFMSYISSAGGVTDSGNLKKAYVQYSNGMNKKIGRFLFFRRYPKVTPGSKIIVPAKTGAEKRGLSVLEISTLAGTLATVISLIAVLKR